MVSCHLSELIGNVGTFAMTCRHRNFLCATLRNLPRLPVSILKMTDTECFFSCDWGTTNCRVRLVRTADGSALGAISSADGAGSLATREPDAAKRRELYSSILKRAARELGDRFGIMPHDCVVSGMASSRLGWQELPYAGLPQPLDGSGLVTGEIQVVTGSGSAGLEVILVSGVRSENDVMRGEEVEVIGMAELDPSLFLSERVTLILPGTHSKHITLKKGQITGLTTFMTGEVFAALRCAPTLRPCLEDGNVDPSCAQYGQGLRDAHSPGLPASLFKIRAGSLLDGTSGADGLAYLSGLLIGGEIAHLHEAAGQIVVAAEGALGGLYRAAFAALGIPAGFAEPGMLERAVILGHRKIINAHRTSPSGQVPVQSREHPAETIS